MQNGNFAKEGSAQLGAGLWRESEPNASLARNIGSDEVIFEENQDKET